MIPYKEKNKSSVVTQLVTFKQIKIIVTFSIKTEKSNEIQLAKLNSQSINILPTVLCFLQRSNPASH